MQCTSVSCGWFGLHIANGNRPLSFGILAFLMPVVKCPRCGKEVEFTGNEFRPFCSERCKLIDFGAWADEEFALPAETESLSDEEMEELVKNVEERSR
jgi:endogenous inhibitor of DNA gyrase (YacG/DUF329 family)